MFFFCRRICLLQSSTRCWKRTKECSSIWAVSSCSSYSTASWSLTASLRCSTPTRNSGVCSGKQVYICCYLTSLHCINDIILILIILKIILQFLMMMAVQCEEVHHCLVTMLSCSYLSSPKMVFSFLCLPLNGLWSTNTTFERVTDTFSASRGTASFLPKMLHTLSASWGTTSVFNQ